MSEGRLLVKVISKDALRQYMAFRGETNASLGQKTGLSKAMIGHLRSGKRATCSGKTASAVERALNAPPGSLFLAEVPHATSRALQSAPRK